MRLPGETMSQAEFDAALDAARRGIVTTDLGCTDEVFDALQAVAADSPKPARVLVDAARAAFIRSQR